MQVTHNLLIFLLCLSFSLCTCAVAFFWGGGGGGKGKGNNCEFMKKTSPALFSPSTLDNRYSA